MLEFHEGMIGEKHVILAWSGTGKVNAAIAAELMAEIYGIEALISAGTAGGIGRTALFDTVIAERVAYHDLAEDILTEFHPWMEDRYFRSDRTLLEAAGRYRTHHRILSGTAVTGDKFIESAEDRERLEREFSPLSVDMESAAIAHTACVNGIPFISIRTITDTEERSGLSTFEENEEKAAALNGEIVTGIIGMLP